MILPAWLADALRRPRFVTTARRTAARSWWQWAPVDVIGALGGPYPIRVGGWPGDGLWTLSVLGILNAEPLPVRICLDYGQEAKQTGFYVGRARLTVRWRRKESCMVKLGSIVADRFTGFRGIATARTEYLYGCVRVCIQPAGLDKDGKPREGEWFDEQRLDETSTATAGGPMPAPPARRDAPRA